MARPPLGGDGEPHRAAVGVDRRALEQSALDQGVDGGRHRRAGEREPLGEVARPFLAADDQRQQPVLGEGHVGARPLEDAGEPCQGEHVAVGAGARSGVGDHVPAG